MKIDFDSAKSDRNLVERGFGFDFAALVFENETLERDASRVEDGETRIQAIGEVDGLVLSVIYTIRGDLRRIISARAASRRERTQWDAR